MHINVCLGRHSILCLSFSHSRRRAEGTPREASSLLSCSAGRYLRNTHACEGTSSQQSKTLARRKKRKRTLNGAHAEAVAGVTLSSAEPLRRKLAEVPTRHFRNALYRIFIGGCAASQPRGLLPWLSKAVTPHPGPLAKKAGKKEEQISDRILRAGN